MRESFLIVHEKKKKSKFSIGKTVIGDKMQLNDLYVFNYPKFMGVGEKVNVIM